MKQRWYIAVFDYIVLTGLGKPPGTLLFSVNVLYISEQNFFDILFFEQKRMNKTVYYRCIIPQ